MKKILLSIALPFFTLLALNLNAQVGDRSEENCQGQSSSIYAVLGSGKSLLVASEGFDCTVCQSKAAQLENLAQQDSNLVTTWGAMTFTYSSAQPSCADLQTWDSTYQWQTVFSFLDSTEHYFQFGTPRYIVYSPVDSSEVYAGVDEVQAFSKARNEAQKLLRREEYPLEQLELIRQPQSVYLKNLPAGSGKLTVYNLAGQPVLQKKLNTSEVRIPWGNRPPGIYLFQLHFAQGVRTIKWSST